MRWPFGSRKPPAAPAESPRTQALANGWWIAGEPASPTTAYTDQLVEEGLARRDGAGVFVPWESVYALQDDAQHETSLHLLALPSAAAVRPVLASQGTPVDPDFRIVVQDWAHPVGGIGAVASRIGPVLTLDSGPVLVPAAVHALLLEMEALAENGARLGADGRMQAMGRIQRLAGRCGAQLDHYLSSSPVVVSEHLEIELVPQMLGDREMVEVRPRPDGAPERWLEHFDRYANTRARYDVPTADGGLSHVVLPEPVRCVAEEIKRFPGRRLGGSQARDFIRNPYPWLGEDAEQVVPPEAVERARQTAGVEEWELDLEPEAQGWGVLLVDPEGARESRTLETLDLVEARQLLGEAVAARDAGHGVLRWRRSDIALAGLTLQSLARLQQASVTAAVNGTQFGGDLLDPSAFSDRVVGFDGKPVLVPRVPRPEGATSWAPDTIPIDVQRVDPVTGQTRSVRLQPADVRELSDRVVRAEREGAGLVRVPGLEEDIPVAEARSWVDGLKDAAQRGPAPPAAPKDPKPAEKLALRILHNIEQLDYRQTAENVAFSQSAPELPAALRPHVELLPHQLEGLAWLQARLAMHAQGVRGVLLGDDMGLGKTLQSLCLMAWYLQRGAAVHPCLIVAPVSLLQNWQQEIEKFLDGSQGRTLALYGDALARHRLQPHEMNDELRERGLKKALRPGFANGAAFVLTTYETLRDYQVSLAREQWGVLVCDEAQKIKTPGAMVTRAAKAMQADFKIACTGTPVENSLADLWCLFDFFQPGLLDSLSSFTKVFRRAIELREDGHDALVESLRNQIAPWVLRRMKRDVAQLQPKHDVPADLDMSARQRALYGSAVREVREAMDAPSSGGNGTTILGLLHRLRVICANPLAVADPQSEYLPIAEHLKHSPKLAWLLDTLEKVRLAEDGAGQKAIVFTEFRDIQRLLQRAVAGRFGIEVDIVNGSTSVDPQAEASRQAIIDRFQSRPGFGVIVLSTTAVGFGVNIQAANHVIHFTRPWNPAKEDQATDRAYRIGQAREVFVYCPTVVGEGFESFEQRVAERLAARRALSEDMLAPEQGIGLEEFAGLEG